MANFTKSPGGKSLHYTLSVQHISGVMGAHIHVGTSTQDGPILISLLNASTSAPTTTNTSGLLVRGTVTSSDIRGNLTGKQIMPHVSMNVSSIPELTNLFTSGNAYVNVHTQQHKNGEIRGQVGPSSNTTAAAPSTSFRLWRFEYYYTTNETRVSRPLCFLNHKNITIRKSFNHSYYFRNLY
ncbi:MAG: CHRD domain-containing protein [Candidatus Nitrosopolaris sp.]